MFFLLLTHKNFFGSFKPFFYRKVFFFFTWHSYFCTINKIARNLSKPPHVPGIINEVISLFNSIVYTSLLSVVSAFCEFNFLPDVSKSTTCLYKSGLNCMAEKTVLVKPSNNIAVKPSLFFVMANFTLLFSSLRGVL